MRINEILAEQDVGRTVAVMPGGYHPFHPGHKSLYDWAVSEFGKANVYVAATNDTSERPFPFDIKKKLASFAGVPESNFIQIKSPFHLGSYQDILGNNSALVFVRSQKDQGNHPKPDQMKKDGTPGYLRSYTGKDVKPSEEEGYMTYGPTINFGFKGLDIKSASEIRSEWPNMDDAEKQEAAEQMYPRNGSDAVKLLDKALGNVSEEAAGVGIVTKQNATADVPVGGEYMNVKKLFPSKKRKSKKK